MYTVRTIKLWNRKTPIKRSLSVFDVFDATSFSCSLMIMLNLNQTVEDIYFDKNIIITSPGMCGVGDV